MGVGRIVGFETNLRGTGPVLGSACSSSGAMPQIGIRHVPNATRITVSGGPPGALGWLCGASAAETSYAGLTLPIGLDPIGLVGCQAAVAPLVAVPAVLGTSGFDRGYAAVDLPWPTLSPTGFPLAAQWLLLDPVAPAFAVTPRHDFRVP